MISGVAGICFEIGGFTEQRVGPYIGLYMAINDIDNKLNPKPDSTIQISFETLDKSYLWNIIDVDNPYYISSSLYKLLK